MDKLNNHRSKPITIENIDVWMDWMLNNYEIAKKDYPQMMELVKEALTEDPLLVSVKIEQIPDNFTKWKNEFENCFESTKVKKINMGLELVQGLLYHWKLTNEYNKLSVEKIKPELLEIESYLKNQLTKVKKLQKETSYVWQSNPDKELPKLYKLMINKYNLISAETTYEQFKAVFTGQPIESIIPIKWHQDNASELLYFNEALKDKVNNVWHIYKRMTSCFVKPNGNQFNAIWKSLKTNIEINLSSDKQKAIDDLINIF